MKISHKVPLIATGIILSSFAIFGTIQYQMIKSNTYQKSESNAREVSKFLENEITLWLNSRLNIVSAMSEMIGDNVDTANINAVMKTKAFASSAKHYFAVLEQGEGKVIPQNINKDIPSDWDGRTRPWYKLAMLKNDAVFTSPYIDEITGNLIISAATPLNGKGVLGADISLKSISDALNTVYFNKTGYAFLVDEKGNIISHPDKKNYGRNISKIYSGGLDSLMTPTLQEIKVDGNNSLSAFYPLDDLKISNKKWYIGVVLDKDKVFASVRKSAINTAITATITALIASILFYFFMLSSLINPVKILVQRSNEISHGKFTDTVEGVTRKDEIGELALAVQRMQKALSMAINRLRK